MKMLSYWDEFVCSGKIEDYLSYKNKAEDEIPEEKTKKEAGYAGFFERNGDGIKDAPYRGLR